MLRVGKFFIWSINGRWLPLYKRLDQWSVLISYRSSYVRL